jgi:hypothetical protein
MKNDLTTGAWQHNIGCPISITLLFTSDAVKGGALAGILLPSEGKTRKTLHQQQIDRRNQGSKANHNLAHAHTISLVAEAMVNAD